MKYLTNLKVRQHPAIEIKGNDVISDKGAEIYEFLQDKKIKYIFIVGVASNECILTKPFGIFSLRTLGFEPILIRDLTDSMHPPDIEHGRANILTIEWIEQYGCSTVDSKEIINGFKSR